MLFALDAVVLNCCTLFIQKSDYMIKAFSLASVLVLCSIGSFAQHADSVVLQTSGGAIFGTLTVPANKGPLPVALFIAGSGPTDRDGNNPLMKNNSLKFLGEALNAQGIATLRYDKRGIAASTAAGPKEADLRFDTYVNDASALISSLKADKRFSKVIVIGHSEGSTIGLKAVSMAGADAMISIAGPGSSADKVLRAQMNDNLDPSKAVTAEAAEQMKLAKEQINHMLDTLITGDTLRFVPISMYSLFRPSVQPYLISWFRYDPQQLIKTLTIPVLIVQGTTDLQVKEADAELLWQANRKAGKVIIPKMNHVLKQSEADPRANHATYIDPTLPVVPALTEAVVSFIRKL